MIKGKKKIKASRVGEYSKEVHGRKLNRIQKSKGEGKKKITNEEKRKFITDVAKDLAHVFTNHQLKSAVSGEEEDGYVVWGYLEEKYPDDWEALLDIEIFDRAVHYSEQNPKPAIIRIPMAVDEDGKKFTPIDINKYIKTPVLLKKEVVLDNYPHEPFRRCIFLSRKPLNEALNWIENCPKDFHGIDINVILASCNLALLGKAMYNLPIFLVVHASGMDEGINEARVRAEDIKEIKVDIRQKLISIQRNDIEPLKAQIFEKEDGIKKWMEMYSDLEKEQIFMKERTQLRQSTLAPNTTTSKLGLSHWVLIGTTVLFFITTLVGFLT